MRGSMRARKRGLTRVVDMTGPERGEYTGDITITSGIVKEVVWCPR